MIFNIIHKNKIITIILAIFVLIAVLLGIITGGFLGFILFALSIVGIYFLFKNSKIVFKHLSPEKTVETFSNAVFKSLKEIGEIDTKGAKVYIGKREDS